MRVLAAEILVPQIAVSVELDERNRSTLFCHSTEDRKADGVIASHANTTHPRLEKRSHSLFDAEKSVLDRERIHREIAKVGDAKLGERIYL